MGKSKKRKTHHHLDRELTHAEIWDDSALIRSWDDAVAEYEYYHSIHARGEDVDAVLAQAEAEENRESVSVTRPVRPYGPLEDTDVLDYGDESGQSFPAKQELPAAAVADTNEDESGPEDGEVESLPDGQHTNAVPLPISSTTEVPGLADSTLEEQKRRLTSQLARHVDSGPQPTPSHTAVGSQGVPSQAPNGHQTSTASDGSKASDDQALENIKMAYYWAGYYSGLYDGQKQREGH